MEAWRKTLGCTLWTAEIVLSEYCLSGVIVLYSEVIHEIRRNLYQTVWRSDEAYGTAVFYCFPWHVSYRYTIKEKMEPDLSKAIVRSCLVQWNTPLCVFPPHNCPGEISSALAVRDDCVFRGQTIDNWKWLLQVFLYLWCRWEDIQVRPVWLHLQEERHAQCPHPGGSRWP